MRPSHYMFLCLATEQFTVSNIVKYSINNNSNNIQITIIYNGTGIYN